MTAVKRRRFGRTEVELSVLTFGSARMLPPAFDERSAAAFLLAMVDRGVTAFHVSHEYDSYPLFCRAFGAMRRARAGVPLQLVAKIGVPHFDEESFSERRFRSLIEEGLRDLGAERIDVVQWLVRQTPNEDRKRLDVLARARDAVAAAWQRLRTEGKVAALGVFPYSDRFLRESLTLPCVDGVVSYLNLLERELVPYLDDFVETGRGVLAIRPLAAGRLATSAPAATAFPLFHPAVASVIIGVSTITHLEDALRAVDSADVDAERFRTLAHNG